MLLRIVSDTHMEQFVHTTVHAGASKWDEYIAPPEEKDSESILILAGDICEFQYIFFYANAWKALARRFIAVVWVPGNHEYCGSSTPYGNKTFFYYKELLRKYGNIYLLDNSSVEVGGQMFYGATLWTNYDNNPVSALACGVMYDFRYGMDDNNDSPRLTVPNDYVERNEVAVDKLTQFLDRTHRDVIVVSHFAPTHQSIHERYQTVANTLRNYHFVNSLDDLIIANPQIKLWVHGHTHTQFDYSVGATRVVCNPKGFPNEDTGPIGDLTFIEVF